MKLCKLALFFLISNQVYAQCLTRHLREAIELNEIRKPLYSQLTNGKSEKISRKLVQREKIALMTSWLLIDKDANHYNKMGIPIICNDLIEMDQTPEFVTLSNIPSVPFKKYPAHRISQKLKSFLRSRDFEGLYTFSDTEIKNLQKGYHCMVRHILESIARSSLLAPSYQRTAVQKNLSDPTFLSVRFIRLTIDQLAYAARLDALAAPIQAQGIPIICQDVPPIAY